MSVSATLQDKYESEAARMKKSEILGFSCIGAGRVIGSPILKDCRPLRKLNSAGYTSLSLERTAKPVRVP